MLYKIKIDLSLDIRVETQPFKYVAKGLIYPSQWSPLLHPQCSRISIPGEVQ